MANIHGINSLRLSQADGDLLASLDIEINLDGLEYGKERRLFLYETGLGSIIVHVTFKNASDRFWRFCLAPDDGSKQLLEVCTGSGDLTRFWNTAVELVSRMLEVKTVEAFAQTRDLRAEFEAADSECLEPRDTSGELHSLK